MTRPLSKPKPHTKIVVSHPWDKSGREVHQLAEGFIGKDGEYALRLVCKRIVRRPASNWRALWVRFDLLDPSLPLCVGCWEDAG